MRLAPLGILLALGIATPVHAQDWRAGTGRLDGKVLDESGQPIAGAVVKLELPGRGGTELRTDTKGRWAILGLTGGEWSVELSAEGYKALHTTLSVSEQSRRPTHEARLERAAGAATSVSPDVRQALASAEAAERDGRLADARAEYERLRLLRSDLSSRIDQQIGLTYVKQNDYARAFEHLGRALAADPDNVPLRAAAVQAAFEARKLEEGKAMLVSLEPVRVDSPDIAFNLGVGLLNAAATAEALPWLSRAIALDASYVDGYYRRALANLQLGRSTESRADFTKVVELAAGTPQAEMARKALEQLR
jgi:tetratricopeptide (TPR) repeat protein